MDPQLSELPVPSIDHEDAILPTESNLKQNLESNSLANSDMAMLTDQEETILENPISIDSSNVPPTSSDETIAETIEKNILNVVPSIPTIIDQDSTMKIENQNP